ncbi:DUF5789 family protein [Haladaptatus sp. NG-SE-30]
MGETMTEESPSRHQRALGIEFGEFGVQLDTISYPTTAAELVASFGEYELDLASGTESVGEILDPLRDEKYQSPGEVRQDIFLMVGELAIGRKYYSDRTPPVLGEQRLDEQVSF